MTDAAIEVQSVKASRRWQGVYLVSLSNEKAFLCPDDVIVRWSLRKGTNLTEEQVTTVLAKAEEVLAKRSAVSLLASRPRSAVELQRGLKKKGFSPSAITAAVQRMQELDYVDDTDYAKRLAEELDRKGKLGRNGIQRALVQRGIPRDVADTVLADMALDNSEREKAFAVASRRFRSYKNLPIEVAHRRLAGFLTRRGFSADTVKWCLEQLECEVDTES